jgi:hypothetical protein
MVRNGSTDGKAAKALGTVMEGQGIQRGTTAGKVNACFAEWGQRAATIS